MMKLILSQFSLLVCLIFVASHGEAQLKAPVAIETRKMEWFDAKRNRQIPAKLHFPATGAGKLPLLIISHGMGGTRDGLDYLGKFWASHGYICAQLQHIGSDESVWRGKGTPAQMRAAMKAGVESPKVINDRPFDVQFAIDEMLRMNLDPKSALFGRIDAQKIGAAGHSFGAFTAQAVAGRGAPQTGWRDPRVIASIALSAPAQALEQSRPQYTNFNTPFYLLTGTRDQAQIGGTDVQFRRVPFDAIEGVEGQLLILNDATHGTFGGGTRNGGKKDGLHHSLIHTSTLLFWDAYLKGDAKAKTELRDGGFAKTLGLEGTFEVK